MEFFVKHSTNQTTSLSLKVKDAKSTQINQPTTLSILFFKIPTKKEN